VATPSLSKGAARQAARQVRALADVHLRRKHVLAEAVEQEAGLAVQAAARWRHARKLPISEAASGASNSTGTLQVLILRAPRRDSARRAA
jgi:hypothetical protein